MPENVNTSRFDIADEQAAPDTSAEAVIRVENVSMVFNMASEQLNSLKEYVISIARRKLFFQGLTAVDNVSFEIKRGDVFGIIGTNGSGKSTLLKIIAGVLEPTSGTCEIKGSIAPLIELGAGFDLELSARENIYLNGALLGYSRSFIDENFDEIVAFAEVEKFLDMPLKNYSSGMVARIAFAIATVIVPEILIVDEVLSVGDFMFQKKCEDRINELIDTHGVTVLIVSHNNDQIARLCDRVLWIEKGHTRILGDAEKVCQIYGALGGRTGSAESEQRVFEAINSKPEGLEYSYNTIAGDDFYGTATRVAADIWKDDQLDTIAVACAATHVNTVLANGIAGSLNIPILQTRPDHIPDSVMHTLMRYKPAHIIYFDCGANGKTALEQLQGLEWEPEITSFSKDIELHNFSKEIYAYGAEHKLWSDTAVLVDFDANPESSALAPFIYKEKCPVFFSSDSPDLDQDDFIQSLQRQGCTRLIIIGKLGTDEYAEALRKAGIETVCISRESSYETCMEICAWVLEQEGEVGRELCLASAALGQWPDIVSCGAYCAHHNTALLLEDPTNLNSITACLDFVSARKADFDRLTFFGSDSNLGGLDRELLANELM